MTESRITAEPSGPAPAARSGSVAQRKRSRERSGHPLMRPFPLVVMTLATFLIVFALLMARLSAGADPALRAGVSAGAISRPVGAAATTLTTRASGAGAAVPAVAQSGAAEGSTAPAAAIVTRTSGAPGASRASDD